MGMTPEGRVKAKVKKLLKPLEEAGTLWKDMPVPGGFGKSTLDFIGCHRGRFFAIETKAPGKQPTKLQQDMLDGIKAARGATFVIIGDEGIQELADWLYRRPELGI